MTIANDRLAALTREQRAALAIRLAQRRGAADADAIPQCVPDRAARCESFPLLPLQRAYLVGRSGAFALGGLASRAYLELEVPGLDRPRLERAWQSLVQRHDMLRVVVDDDGTQRVLAEVPGYRIAHSDLGSVAAGQAEGELERIRREMLADLAPANRWPLFDVRTTSLAGGSHRLHVCLDLLVVDAASIVLLFRDLESLYQNPGADLPALELSFRDYAIQERSLRGHPGWIRARDYWMARVDELPSAPQLPTVVDPTSIASVCFNRCTREMGSETTAALKALARRLGLTTTALHLAAYAEVLARWSDGARFTINIPLFNRLPVHPDVDRVVGPFSSVELLAVDCSLREPFEDRARRVQDQLLEDLAHREFDGVELLRELARRRGAGAAAMPVVFTSLLDHGFAESIESFGRLASAINQTAQVWTDLHVDEHDGKFLYKWDWVDGLFPAGMIGDMLDTYVRLLAGLVEQRPLSGLALLPADQVRRRIEANSTEAAMVSGLAHEPFLAHARVRPLHPALISGPRTLTYGELAALARSIGNRLRTEGVRPDTLVGIVMEKGWEQIAAVMGVLVSGGAYMPVDAEVPRDRCWHLLADGGCRVVLTQHRLLAAVEWPPGMVVLAVDDDREWRAPDGDLAPAQGPSNLAYVLHTSGSTGAPKGVMIEHRSIVNRMSEMVDRFAIDERDRIICITALHHDLSVFDIFAGLRAGATLVVPEHDGRRDPAHWAQLLERNQVTLWNSVPAFMTMLTDYLEHGKCSAPMQSLRHVMLSGDWIPVTLPERIRALSPHTVVTSLGGPTETTVWDVSYRVDRVDPGWKSIPYGRPLRNAEYHILDARLEPCPDYVTGELYLGGAGLARGYWGDPEKTADKFIVHPDSGARLYRSGDLGRWLPDGNIEFMGRRDSCVKIQGQRIELGEIESTIGLHPGVRENVVAVMGDDPETRRLAAWVVLRDETLDMAALHRFLTEKLPAHMVPSAMMQLTELPLTDNGKIDRRNLPDPRTSRTNEPFATVGGSDLEREIATMVGEILNLNDIDPELGLLTYGATSIDLVRLGNRLERAFGHRPRMDELFRLDSIRALATYYGSRVEPDLQSTRGDVSTPNAVSQLIASYRVLLDPGEREAFKNSQPGIRKDLDSQPTVALRAGAEPDPGYAVRRTSCRRFSLSAVPFGLFSDWLAGLRQIVEDGKAKYLYASAGSLYPIQTYLHVQPERVEGIDGGTYYYRPTDHRLVCIERPARIDRRIHIPFINTPIFDEAAFSVFLIADMAAVAPGYGERSFHFATLEAGIITHLLDMRTAGTDIGLCNIGTVEFDAIRPLFRLGPSHVLVHSLLGGLRDTDDNRGEPPPASDSDPVAAVQRMIARVVALSDEDVRRMLAVHDSIPEDQP